MWRRAGIGNTERFREQLREWVWERFLSNSMSLLQGSKLIGIVSRDGVPKALATHSDDTFVTEIMVSEFLKIEASKSLDETRRTMAERGTRIAAVYDGANYLGLISNQDIIEAFSVQTFVERQKQSGRCR